MNRRPQQLILALLSTALASCSHAPAGKAAAPARVATVYLFIAPDCPISNGYAPEIVRIANSYTPRGVAFVAVHADPRISLETAQEHARQYGYHFPVMVDADQKLAHRVGATVTPEAAVVDAEGRVVYLGRIDDVYYGFGKRREAPTRHDLRDALDAVLAKGHIEPIRGELPFGCEIPPPPSKEGTQ